MLEWYFQLLARSTGAKKFVSTTAVADKGDAQALWLPPSTGRRSILLGDVRLFNRSGSAAVVGIGVRFRASAWQAGSVTAAGAYTDDTPDAQDEDTADLVLHDKDDSGSGIVVGAVEPWNILGIVQSAAGDQTTPTKVVDYWNGAAWVDIVANLVINDTLIGAGTGEKVLLVPIMPNWAKGGSGTGVPASLYNLRIRHTNGGAGTANPTASQLFVGYALIVGLSVADGGEENMIPSRPLKMPRSGDGVFPVFSVASGKNLVEAEVSSYE